MHETSKSLLAQVTVGVCLLLSDEIWRHEEIQVDLVFDVARASYYSKDSFLS